jgi:hypothetical protein
LLLRGKNKVDLLEEQKVPQKAIVTLAVGKRKRVSEEMRS